MKEKIKNTIKIIAVGLLITILSILAFEYSFPLDPNPFMGGI